MFISALYVNNSHGGDNKCLYIHIILYIPCIVFYCFASSGYTDKINVICGLILYLSNIISYLISLLAFEISIELLILFGIISGLLSSTILIIFHLKFINDGLITFKISTVGLSEIIYLIII